MPTPTTVLPGTCPECASTVDDQPSARLGEVVECAGCSAELEIVGLAPMTYALAPEVEEDWGE